MAVKAFLSLCGLGRDPVVRVFEGDEESGIEEGFYFIRHLGSLAVYTDRD